jgi:hypothetical protein
MNRSIEETEILGLAAERVYVTGYGPPERTLGRIAALWGAYLEDASLTAYDVARMMILLKVARDVGFAEKRDNYVDIAGYSELLAAMMAEGENV